MMVFRIESTERPSECSECGERIEPGTPKLIHDGYADYNTCHLDCVDGGTIEVNK